MLISIIFALVCSIYNVDVKYIGQSLSMFIRVDTEVPIIFVFYIFHSGLWMITFEWFGCIHFVYYYYIMPIIIFFILLRPPIQWVPGGKADGA
jgi:hypothetical protein